MTVITVAAGSGRGGSTLTSQLLGRRSGCYNVGELRQLWVHYERGYQCSCGETVAECALWSAACSSVAASLNMDTAVWVARLATISRDKWRVAADDRDFVLKSLHALVLHVCAATESAVLIDSSKMPRFLTQLATAVPTDFVHLLRDSRAVAHSWKNPKVKSYAGGSEMRTRSVVVSTFLWSQRHLAQEWVGRRKGRRRTQVRYEDLCADPDGELAKLWLALGSEAQDEPSDGPAHALAGNPGRFGKPITDITLDDAWRRSMSKAEIAVVSILSWPLRLRYGYVGSHR